MSGNGTSGDDALLARLNALKKSSVNLDARKPLYEPATTSNIPIDPAPAKALHSDLLDRFKSLTGSQPRPTGDLLSGSRDDHVELFADDDGKTVEDLLAELGPEDSWNLPKDEETQIQELLKSATSALKASEQSANEATDQDSQLDDAKRQDRDVGSSSALNDTKPANDDPGFSEADLDREADDYLAQILDEIKHQPQIDAGNSDSEQTQATSTKHTTHTDTDTDIGQSMDLPAAPLNDLDLPPSYTEATVDDSLAARFANLGLPSVPTTIKTSTTTQPKQQQQQPKYGYADEEIYSWCVICNEDATLRCIGCDGDLYCTSCWLEGHKGEDAGYEERTHKAVQYSKKSGMRKQTNKKTLMGA